MSRASVVLLTDRRDRSRALADAVRTIAVCRVVGADEPLLVFEPVMGVIADVDLDHRGARRCLKTMVDAGRQPRVPMIVLTRTPGDTVVMDATRLGATACLSELTEPKAVVAALFGQIDPGMTMVDRLVAHSATRTGMLLADMLGAARSGPIDRTWIEEGVDPVVDAMRDGGLRRWLGLVQSHDDPTLRHCLLVAGIAAHFTLHLNFPSSDRAALVRAALVHDVGKARVPVGILNKPGPLDAAEMAVIRTHPDAGHAILVASGMTDPLTLAATRHHHEMLDGSGYPDGLRGDQIGDAVRLLTICDIAAALIEHRPYRPPTPQAETLTILRKMAGRGLEPALVEAFAQSISEVDVTTPMLPAPGSPDVGDPGAGPRGSIIAWTVAPRRPPIARREGLV